MSQTEKYVVLADSNIAVNFDFNALLDAHIKNEADVTVVYQNREIPEIFTRSNTNIREYYYSFEIDDQGWVKKIYLNPRNSGITKFGLNIYVMEREHLVELIDEAYLHGYTFFVRDLLAPQVDTLDIYGYCYDGYVAHIHDMQSYFDENMRLLKEENIHALFEGNQIYTKIRDDNPTRYKNGSKAKNVLVADGCLIEGEVENSVLFRGVKIGKGAKVKNCVLMQDTIIEDGASVEYVITDKNVRVTADKSLTGNDSYQVFVSKRQIV
jgi:glucose-1-phosphate adenylyltransferase